MERGVGLNHTIPPQRCHANPQALGLTRQKGLCRYDETKSLELGESLGYAVGL